MKQHLRRIAPLVLALAGLVAGALLVSVAGKKFEAFRQADLENFERNLGK